MIVAGITIVDGLCIRFPDAENKKRPAVVLAVIDLPPDEEGFVLVLEGTTRAKYKQRGTTPLVEVRGPSPLQHAMGLSSTEDTYFYPRETAIKLIGKSAILFHGSRACFATDDDLRKMQEWALRHIAACTDPLLVQAAALMSAQKHTTGETAAAPDASSKP